MDQLLKAKWVAALRGGEIKQGKGSLIDDHGAMCCIGVLGSVIGIPHSDLYKCRDGIFAGIEADPELRPINAALSGIDGWKARVHELARMNDDDKTFAEIADHIEANL